MKIFNFKNFALFFTILLASITNITIPCRCRALKEYEHSNSDNTNNENSSLTKMHFSRGMVFNNEQFKNHLALKPENKQNKEDLNIKKLNLKSSFKFLNEPKKHNGFCDTKIKLVFAKKLS